MSMAEGADPAEARKSLSKRNSSGLQDNPFLRVFSVKETLTFFARLRLPHGTPAAEVARRVDEVMAELDLTVSVHAAGPGGVGGAED